MKEIEENKKNKNYFNCNNINIGNFIRDRSILYFKRYKNN